MRVTLEADPKLKLHQLGTWARHFMHLDRRGLINLGTNPNQTVKNINVRHDALLTLRKKLDDIKTTFNKHALLTDDEVERLFNLIKDDEDFPILVDSNEISVEEVTHLKGQEDEPHKKMIRKDIEENTALLKAEALFLIVDFGLLTKKFASIRKRLIETITNILTNMLHEPEGLFIRKLEGSDESTVSPYFKYFVEALYFIDRESAKPFMKISNIKESDFNPMRKVG